MVGRDVLMGEEEHDKHLFYHFIWAMNTQDSLDSLLPRVHTCNKREKRVSNGLIGCVECVLRIMCLECNY